MPSAAAIIPSPELEREPNGRLADAIRKFRSTGTSITGALTLPTPSGGRVDLPMTASAIEALEAALSRLAEGDDLVMSRNEAELSPEETARILGISRPMVYHRMDTGRLPFRSVGTHRRVLYKDVLALKDFEERRRQFSKAMSEDTDEQDAGPHGP